MTDRSKCHSNFFSNLNKCYLIAEIGVNHNGDITLAKEMIRAAKTSGADAVKFQTFKAERLVSEGTPKVNYQKSTTSPDESHYEMIRKLELSEQDHIILKEFCDEVGIEFMSTPYDIESARFLHEIIGVKLFKTASADVVDLPLQRYIASTGKPSVVSVGMATLAEVESVCEIYKHEQNSNLVLLHCVSNYPCADESLNLRVMDTLRQAFQVSVGYSDHSNGCVAAVLSIAYGACVIEKHFTLDKSLAGPDHLASSTPEEFAFLAESIRRAEVMLGSSVKACQPEEQQMALVSRKSIVLGKSVNSGETIEEGDLVLKRPGSGLLSSELTKVIGRKATKNLSKNHRLMLGDFE
ncbi:MAG: N-acetylneuraminate synthase [Pseudohongiella sp.]|nr:N-acetylneuraminate synthase [Pseudohongiella sp.]